MAVNITPDSKKNVTTTPDSRKNVTINTETKKVTVNTQSDNSVANNVSVPSGDTYVNVTPDSNKNVTATTETKQVSVSTQSVNSVSVSSEKTTSVVNVTALGPQGIQGPQGIAGPTGSLGPIGPEGPTGAQGIQGIAGPSGSAFFTGGEIRSDTSVTGSFTVSSSNVDFSDTTSITGSVFTGIFQGALSSSEQISSNISGSTNSLSSSLSTRLTTDESNITNLQTDSGSFSTRLTTAESELDNTLISSSAQISTDISGSFIEPSSSFSTRITTAETELSNTLISSSAQISTDISGSFTAPSASISTRLTTNETGITNLQTNSGSFSTRITTAETELSNTLISGSTQITQLGFVSESFSTGGTGIISGSEQLPTGLVSGSAQSVTHITGADLDMGGNKVLFSNVYSTEGDLPSASTYHGMFAHVHATGRGYFAHAGDWHPLVNLSEGVISGSAQISSDISGSFTAPSASISTRLTTAESELSNTLISSSAQISTEISGSFTAPSASISTRLTTAESELSNTLISSSAQIASDISGSFGNQRVGTTDNVNFASVTTSGNVNVGGNLDVSGTTTSIDSATLNIGDKNITIGSGSTTSAQLDEAGIDFGLGGGVSNIRYRHSDTSITSSVDFRAPNFYGTFNGALSSSAQISNDISGSFTAASSSFSTRITTAETELGNTLISSSTQVDHDTTTNFVSNEHIDHSGVTLTAGDGLSGGGDITTNRSFAVDNSVLRTTGDNVVTSSAQISTDISGSFTAASSSISTRLTTAESELGNTLISSSAQIASDISGSFTQPSASISTRLTTEESNVDTLQGRTLTAGDGLTGGGTLESDRTFAVDSSVLRTTGDNIISGSTQITGFGFVSGSLSGTLSSSAQIAEDISGSFVAPSASISTRLTTAETELSNTLVSSSVQVDHDATTNFVANEHIDHSTVSISTGGILSGGGTIASNRTITLASSDVVHDSTSGFVSNEHIDHTSITLTAGDGLSGGGDISSNRSFAVDNTVLRTTGDNVLSGSAQISTDISGSFTEVSSSLASRISSNEAGSITSVTAGNGLTGGGSSGGVTLNVVGGDGITVNADDIEVDNTVLRTTGDNVVSSSAQISTDISGSFIEPSASISTRLTTAETELSNNLISSSTQVNHDTTTNFVANEHIDHTSVSISAGDGLSGGGTIASNRTLAVDATVLRTTGDNIVSSSAQIASDISGSFTAGTGLDLSSGEFSVDVSDFMTNGSNNRILTATGTDGQNAEANFTIDGTSLQLGDGKILSLGNSDDLQIHHTTNQNIVELNTGNLTFRDESDNNIMRINIAGGVDILEGNLTVAGNLDVQGTTTTIDSTEVSLGDRILTLNAGSAAGDGGLYVNDASTAETGSLLWDVSEDRWIGGLKDSEVNLVTISSTDTLTNKTINASNNTLSNIGNSSLTNSSINYGGVSVSLGGSDTTPAFDLSDATSLPIVAGTSGTLSVARGGTGATTFTSNSVLTGNGTSAIQAESNLTYSSLTLQIPSASGKVSVDTLVGYSNNTNTLLFNDDQDSANNQVSLQSINHINIMTDGNNNGTGNFRVYNGSYDVDTADLAFQIGATSDATFYGDVTVPHLIEHSGDTNTYVQFTTDRLRFAAGGETLLDLFEGTQDYVKLGDGGDVDINLNDDMFVEGSSGNVGIGTSSPSAKLEISNDVGHAQNTVLVIKSDDPDGDQGASSTADIDFHIWDSNTRLSTPQARIGVVGNGTANQNSESGGQLVFYTNVASYSSPSLTERMRIDASGNVGIGTTSPNMKLNISHGDNDGIRLNSTSTTGQAIIDFGDSGDNDAGSLRYDHDGNVMKFIANAAERMRIDGSTANVGIGTSSNTSMMVERLTAYNAANANVLGLIGVGSSGDTNFVNINFRNLYSSATGASATIGVDTGNTTDKGQLVFSTSGGSMNVTERMRIDESGNVGIGTNSPDTLLHLNEDDNVVAFKVTGGNGGNKIASFIRDIGVASPYAETYIHAGSGDPQITFRDVGNTTYSIGLDDSANAFKISEHTGVGTNDRIVVNDSGTVYIPSSVRANGLGLGIGDTAPQNTLHVDATTSSNVVARFNTDNTFTFVDLYNDDTNRVQIGNADDGDFIIRTNDVERFRVDKTTGRVGIGTTSPGELLHVDGSIEFAGRKYNRGSVSVAGAGSGNGQAITLSTELGTTLHVNYQYKITLNTTGTGTDTGAVYILTYDQDGGAWDLHLVSRNGSSSNHPLAIVDGSNLKAYHNHSGTYNILYFVELWDMSADDGTLHGWGADYQWTRDVDTLSYSAGDVNIDSGTFYVDVSANRVGLLDTSPDATLQIGSGTDGKLFHTDGLYNDVTFNGGSGGTNGVWEFVNSGTWGQTRMYVQDANNVAGRLTFDFRGNAGSNKILAGDSTGKVGIGTLTPGEKLTIKAGGTTSQEVIKIRNSSNTEVLSLGLDSGGDGYLNFNTSPGIINTNAGNLNLDPAGDVVVDGASLYLPVAEKLYFGGGNHTYIGEDADDRLRFFVGGDEFMRFTQQDSGGEIFSIYQDVYLPDDKKIHFGGGNDLDIYHFNAAGDSRINVTNNPLLITYNGVDRFRLASGDLVINEGGGDYNFRVEGDTDTNLFVVDAGTDKVGIGIGTPSAKLDVKSQINVTNSSNVSMVGLKGTNFGYSTSYKALQIGNTSSTFTISLGYDPSTNTSASFTGDGREILFRNGVEFTTPNAANNGFHNDILVLKDGNVGIGTASPGGKLDIKGSASANNLTISADMHTVGGGHLSNYQTLLFKNTVNGTGLAAIRHYANSHNDSASQLRFLTSNTSGTLANQMTIDDTGFVGIGTTSPQKKLHVSTGDTGIAARFENTTSNGTVMELLASGDSTTMYFQTDHIYSSSNLHLGSGTLSNVYRANSHIFQVGSGNTTNITLNSNQLLFAQPTRIQFANDQRIFDDGGGGLKVGSQYNQLTLFGGTNTGEIRFFAGGRNGTEKVRFDANGNGHFVQDVVAYSSTPSDIRLKKNFTKIDNGLDIISKLDGQTFNWKKGGDRLSAGFKAQEVEKVLPHLVNEKKLPLHSDDDKDYKVLRYEELIPYLVESIKELKIVVETQQKEIKDLKNKL